ncbi:MAG: DNA polymerase/3'-5' exonuclease PolX [Planctomycetes bacterium]|nr:DNA polymerase/3'-5' exonuclease PolX [Planctomycetota bacterium]
MSVNAEIAKLFFQMADALEVLGENPFKVLAHRKAARVLEDLADDVADLVKGDPEKLRAIEGFGAATVQKIEEFVKTGKIKGHDELLAKLPPGLIDVLRVPGLGPKTVKLLWEQGGVTNLATLKKQLASGALAKLPRMGEKTLKNIAENLAFLETAGERARLGDALPIAEAFVQELRKVPGVKQADYAGSLRRGQETIGDIDLLAATLKPAAAMEFLCKHPQVAKVLASGETKSSVRLHNGMQVDLRAIPPADWGAALLYFTGSKDHNVILRERAIAQKMRLNEYGLFPDDGNETPPQQRGVKAVASKSEEEIYAKLGLEWIAPELRQGRDECEKNLTSRLIDIKDIRRELHAHTTASDGGLSIEELIEEARSRGFDCIAITDHSRSSAQANGLSIERLREHAAAIRKAAKKAKDIHVLVGSEVDILADGHLDYPDEVLAELDWVVASPHTALKQTPDAATERLLKAIANPYVHVIGHPTGRIINGRPGLEPHMKQVIAAAAKAKVALEINSNPARLDLRDAMVRAAHEGGAMISINTDAHASEHFDFLRYGILTARRAGLPPEGCVNAWPWKKFEKWRLSRGRN